MVSAEKFRNTPKHICRWCGPCRAIAPHIDSLATDAEDVSILKVDIDQHEALAAQYQIRVGSLLSPHMRTSHSIPRPQAVPTFKFLQGGAVVDEVQGADVNGIDAALGRLQAR